MLGWIDAGERPLAGVRPVEHRQFKIEDGVTADLMRGEELLMRCRASLDGFVQDCCEAGAWGGTTRWVRDVVALDRIPMVAVLSRGAEVLAMAFGGEVVAAGRRLRLGGCGNVTGQRGFFAREDVTGAERAKLARAAADVMMRGGLIGLLVSSKDEALRDARGLRGQSAVAICKGRKVYDTFQLGGTMDESLARLGAHTRRNLRYYRRRAMKELGAEYLPMLEGAAMRAAVVELQFATDDVMRAGIAKNRIAQSMSDSKAFCMGLKAADGRWLSWLTGWRVGKETYVDWQCNRGGLPRYSLSTVMRSYLIEHESEMGQRTIRFLGGTPHTMHYGFQEDLCEDWLVLPRGPWGWMAKPLGRSMRRLKEVRDALSPRDAGHGGRAARVGAAAQLLKRIAGVLMADDEDRS